MAVVVSVVDAFVGWNLLFIAIFLFFIFWFVIENTHINLIVVTTIRHLIKILLQILDDILLALLRSLHHGINKVLILSKLLLNAVIQWSDTRRI